MSQPSKLIEKRVNIKKNTLKYEDQPSKEIKIERQINNNPNLEEMIYEGQNGGREKLIKFMEETAQLGHRNIKQLFQQYSDYNEVSFKLFTPKHILNLTDRRVEKMRKNRKLKKNWSPTDVNILVWIVTRYAQKFNIPLSNIKENIEAWQRISELIPGTTPSTCMFRWLSLKKYKLTSHAWNEDESQILANIVNQFGRTHWKSISEYLYQLNPDPDKVYRQPKQCRQHWMSFLNPNLKKGVWSPKQDIMLLRWVYYNEGVRKWYKIAHMFEGRTQNAIKNRYHLIIDKCQRKREGNNKTELELVKLKLDQLETKNPMILSGIPSLPLLKYNSNQKELKQNYSSGLQNNLQAKQEIFQDYIEPMVPFTVPNLFHFNSNLNYYLTYPLLNNSIMPMNNYSGWIQTPYINYNIPGYNNI